MQKTIQIALFALAVVLASCGGNVPSQQQALSPQVAFDSLITYIENSGDFINSPNAPAIIPANQLYNELDGNILVIDMRNADEFGAAHIPNSVNMPFGKVLDYFENTINPNSFNKIVLVCNAGQTAKTRWLARVSNKYSELLEREPAIMHQPESYPKIETQQLTGYNILRERAHMLFKMGFNAVTISADTLFAPDNGFYIINYWSEESYLKGHIPTAVRYQPNKSLKRVEQLNTLPLNKPIVAYDYTGQQSSFITAYLRLLGYEVYTLTYGANGFMNGLMLEQGIPNAFTDDETFDLPVSSGSSKVQLKEAEDLNIAPRGGC
jgi:rhodanese-related sulfurtransferase